MAIVPRRPGRFPRRPSRSPERLATPVVLFAMLTMGALLAALVSITMVLDEPLLVPSFATSAAIIACLPELPVAQPRHVVGGHLLGAVAGYLLLAVDVNIGVQVTLAVTLSVGAMLLVRVLHPPGAATAALVVLDEPRILAFFVVLTLAGVLVTIVGALSSRLIRSFHYPVYWW